MEDPEGQVTAAIEPTQGDSPADVGGAVDATPVTGPISLDDAFNRAVAEAGEPTDPAGHSEPEGVKPAEPAAQPEGAAAKPAEPAPSGQAERSAEAELDRIHEAIRNNSVEKLPTALRGRAQAIQRETIKVYDADRKQFEQFSEMYLQLEATKAEDPKEFNRLMFDDPEAANRREFYETFHREYPDVTLDNPQPGKGGAQTVEAAKHEAAREIFGDLNETLVAMARESGLPADAVDKLRQSAQGPWGYLTSVYTEAVKAGIEKERPKIRQEEAKAARLEAQAEWANKKIVVPRELGLPAGKPARDPSKRPTWEDAFAEARDRASA